jgi:hypothetical protein
MGQSNVAFEVLENGVWMPLNAAVTNSHGIASTAYKPDEAGTLTIRATYAGNAKYVESESSQTLLEVTEDNLMLSALPYIIAVLAVAIIASVFVIRRRKKKQV